MVNVELQAKWAMGAWFEWLNRIARGTAAVRFAPNGCRPRGFGLTELAMDRSCFSRVADLRRQPEGGRNSFSPTGKESYATTGFAPRPVGLQAEWNKGAGGRWGVPGPGWQ
jgi:hypothetical protein